MCFLCPPSHPALAWPLKCAPPPLQQTEIPGPTQPPSAQDRRSSSSITKTMNCESHKYLMENALPPVHQFMILHHHRLSALHWIPQCACLCVCVVFPIYLCRFCFQSVLVASSIYLSPANLLCSHNSTVSFYKLKSFNHVKGTAAFDSPPPHHFTSVDSTPQIVYLAQPSRCGSSRLHYAPSPKGVNNNINETPSILKHATIYPDSSNPPPSTLVCLLQHPIPTLSLCIFRH